MPTIICPTITAFEPHEYRSQMEQVADFAKRVHIDVMDGIFAPTVSPAVPRLWWPHHLKADIHLMYQKPDVAFDQLTYINPDMVIIHAEADVDHMQFAAKLHAEGIRAGLALLQQTTAISVERIVNSFDHVLIFSGTLGYHGGTADMQLLEKVRQIRDTHPDVEIGWDGGVTTDNAWRLIEGGVQVLNVGGAIQKASDPRSVYNKMTSI